MNLSAAELTVRLFQEAVLRPELWPQALGQLSATFGSTGVLAQMVGPEGYAAFSSPSFDEVQHDFLLEGWNVNHSRMERGLALTKAGRTGFITEYHMFSSDELKRDPYQQEFAPRHRLDAEAGMVVASYKGAGFVLSAPRGYRIGSYSASELETMNRLADALRASCEFALNMKLTHARNMVDSFSAGGRAIALLTPNGSSLFHTAAFEHLLGHGLALRDGKIHASEPVADISLQALLHSAAHWPGPESFDLQPVFVLRESKRPLVLRAHPIVGAARDFLGLARTILVVDDLERRPHLPPAEIVAQPFGLTPAEARLAIRLSLGETLREAADKESINYESARTRLKMIFLKTNTSRQTELALLVNRLAGGW